MDIVHERAAGLDTSNGDTKLLSSAICDATTAQILDLGDLLELEHVSAVVMEATRIPALIEALTGRCKAHHAFMPRLHLDQTDAQSRIIDALTGRIEEAMTSLRAAREFLATIPGVSLKVADVIIAETGADMSRLETPGRLASCNGHVNLICRIKHDVLLEALCWTAPPDEG